MNYTIKLQQFEGPFDLLLFFIKRDELDIYDIPITKITADFLDYIRNLERLNIDVASEFILVAATLMRIKSKMLLPRKEIDEQGDEVDPREELVQRLLEYQRYKEVLSELQQMEEDRAKKAQRGNIHKELQQLADQALADAELESLSLYKLMRAFKRVMQDFTQSKVKKVHTILTYQYTVKEQEYYVRQLVNQKQKVNFVSIFHTCENRIHAIVTFLSILELANRMEIKVIEGDGVNQFWIAAHTDKEEEE